MTEEDVSKTVIAAVRFTVEEIRNLAIDLTGRAQHRNSPSSRPQLKQ